MTESDAPVGDSVLSSSVEAEPLLEEEVNLPILLDRPGEDAIPLSKHYNSISS